MQAGSNIASKLFHAIGALGIGALACAHGHSAISFSVAISGQDTKIALQAIHTSYNLSNTTCSIYVLCAPETHASNASSPRNTDTIIVLEQIRNRREQIASKHGVILNVVGMSSSTGIQAAGVDINACIVEAQERSSSAMPSDEVLEGLQKLPVPILVDCSGGVENENFYQKCLERGIHVIACSPNSVAALSERCLDAYRLPNYARSMHGLIGHLQFSSTIGARLPVLQTMEGISNRGESIVGVDAQLSATATYLLDFIYSHPDAGLGDAVSSAIRDGITETDWTDDVNGAYVVRQLKVLARALNVPANAIELESVTPLIPKDILEQTGLLSPSKREDRRAGVRRMGSGDEDESFVRALNEAGAMWVQTAREAIASQKKICFLAKMRIKYDENGVPSSAAFRVAPDFICDDHFAFRLQKTEIAVSFFSQGSDTPLTIMGRGTDCGSAVCHDILKICKHLKG